MTDLHTHILPGIDDGAENADESIAMLKMERDQGVKTVVLTPHFYRDRENPRRFLRRRQEAALELAKKLRELSDEERNSLPKLVLGAEVAWWPDMDEWDDLSKLCIGETKNLLLELPFTPWNGRMIDQIYNLAGRTGIRPVFAHLERYLKIQPPELIDEVLDLGFPIQIGTDALVHSLRRGGVMKLLKDGKGNLIASDCHDNKKRAPNLKEAMRFISRKLGADIAEDFSLCADELAGITAGDQEFMTNAD